MDEVAYSGLTPSETYKVSGILMDKSTGEPLEVNGQQITAEVEFTPEAESGTVELTYTLDASALAGKSVVVFETLYQGDVEVTSHADINDENQTVTFVKPDQIQIGTTAMVDGEKMAIPVGEITLTDVVSYYGLTPGETYTLYGVLMDKGTGQPLLVNGEQVTSASSFVPTAKDGTVEVTFTLNADDLVNKQVVVFETLYLDGKEIASHTDINDQGQTVTFGEKPEIGTTATVDGEKEAEPKEEVTITDTVEYSGLIPGKTYKVTGVLMDKDTEKPLLVNDKQITAEVEFVAEAESGTVELTYTLDASALAGKHIVVYETLYYGDKEIASHADITDEDQTVVVTLKGRILGTKVDTDGTKLEGVVFGLFPEGTDSFTEEE